MQLKYMGSKAWLAPHLDRMLGDVTVLHSPFFGSGKLEYYLAARRPALEARGVDAFEPVANLHRCYLRRDPVFLRSLLLLVGRKVDRRFYFSRLLPGSQRGRASGCLLIHPAAQQLLGKVGLLHTAAATGAEQRAASATTADKCNRGGLPRSEPGPRLAVVPRKTLRRTSSGTGPLLRTFSTQKRAASGDKAVANGDKLGGMEFNLAGSSSACRVSDFPRPGARG